MTTIKIPTSLRSYTSGQTEIAVQGQTVGQVMDHLTAQYPAMRPHLFTEEGKLRSFVNLFLNDKDVRHLQGVDTPVAENDRVVLIPSIAGGRS